MKLRPDYRRETYVAYKMRTAPISACGTIRRHISAKVTYWIYFLITPFRKSNFVFGALESHLPLTQNGLIACFEFP
jgi:hypothetical protein